MNTFDTQVHVEEIDAEERMAHDWHPMNDVDSDEWMSTEELAEFGLTRQTGVDKH